MFDKFSFNERNLRYRSTIVNRIGDKDTREDSESGPEDDLRFPFHEAFENHPDDPYIINLARGIVDSWLVCDPYYTNGEYFAGFQRPKRECYEHFSFGIITEFDEVERSKKIKDKMRPLDEDYMHERGIEIFGEAEYKWAKKYLWSTGGFQGHTIPSYDKLLTLGIGGTIEQIDYYDSITPEGNTKKKLFYKACRMIMEGFSAWFIKLADEAEVFALKPDVDDVWAGELREMAAVCRQVSWDAPKTFRQAGQLMWGFCLWDFIDCVGRFDQYMYPFWTGADEEKYMLADLMLKFWEHGVHNMTLGGVKPHDGTPELTYLVLAIIRENHDVHPRVTLRVHDGTPDELLEYVTEIWSENMSDPTVASDKTIIAGLMEYGVTPEDARNYSVLGCQEIEIPGKSNFGCEDGVINLAKLLELAMYNGRDRHFGSPQVGLAMGNLTDFDTFDKLWNAYTAQVEYFTRYFCELCNYGVDIRIANVAKLVKSCMTEACIERGLQLDEGGSVYNYGCVETAGHGAVGDSLYAIKKLVYDEKKLSLETLDAALKANFEGYEEVRQMLRDVPKYGNDHEEADAMAARVLEHFWREIGKYTSRRGGVYTGACSLLTDGNYMGVKTGPLPDGRRAGETLGNTIGPRTSSDRSGVTAMLASVAKMPLKLGVGGSTCNVLFPKEILQTPESRRKIAGLVRTFMIMGGQLAQVTTASKEDMIDAKVHPEDHENLIVRVGGYSKRFNECGEDTKDEIIKRYGD